MDFSERIERTLEKRRGYSWGRSYRTEYEGSIFTLRHYGTITLQVDLDRRAVLRSYIYGVSDRESVSSTLEILELSDRYLVFKGEVWERERYDAYCEERERRREPAVRRFNKAFEVLTDQAEGRVFKAGEAVVIPTRFSGFEVSILWFYAPFGDEVRWFQDTTSVQGLSAMVRKGRMPYHGVELKMESWFDRLMWHGHVPKELLPLLPEEAVSYLVEKAIASGISWEWICLRGTALRGFTSTGRAGVTSLGFWAIWRWTLPRCPAATMGTTSTRRWLALGARPY